MTDQSRAGERNQADERDSRANLAGGRADDKPAARRAADALPLSEGAVASGAHDDVSGAAPAEATDASHEASAPLDSRETFGGGNVRHARATETPAAPDPARQARLNGTGSGDDGYDPLAGRGPRQEAD